MEILIYIRLFKFAFILNCMVATLEKNIKNSRITETIDAWLYIFARPKNWKDNKDWILVKLEFLYVQTRIL